MTSCATQHFIKNSLDLSIILQSFLVQILHLPSQNCLNLTHLQQIHTSKQVSIFYAISKGREITALHIENRTQSQLAPLDMQMLTMGSIRMTESHILVMYS